MAWAMAAIAVGSALYGAYQQSQAGADAQEAAEARASLLNQQAQEVIERGLINREIYAREGIQTLGMQQVNFAKLGIDVGSSSPLLAAQYTANAIGEELLNMQRETEYEAMAIRNDAQGVASAGADAARAAKLQSYGTVISGASRAYSAYQVGNSTNTSTGGTP